MKQLQLCETIDEFVAAFEEVYGVFDRERSIEQMWLQVVEEASSVAEAVREVNYADVVSHLANTFCWICGLVAKCRQEGSILHSKQDFSSTIWRKYPSRCPLCGITPCQCLIKKREIDQRSPEEKNRAYDLVRRRAIRTIADRIKNLDRIVDMFEDIFGPSYFVMPIEEITFHFIEEVGEVAEQIRELRALDMSSSIKGKDKERRKKQITEEFLRELADVFSWMCAVLIKIDYMIGNVNSVLTEFGRSKSEYRMIKFSEIMEKYYSDNRRIVCRTCKQSPCNVKKHEKIYQISE